MKKTFLTIALSLVAVTLGNTQTVFINFGSGEFFASINTTTPSPAGARINILALESGSWSDINMLSTFQNLTSSFTPAGSVLVAALATNDSDGPGTTANTFTFSYSGNFSVGDELLMVVYPNLTLADLSPGQNTSGFWFRTDAIIDGSNISWVAPSDGTWDLGAYTISLGGSLPDDQFTAGNLAEGGAGFTTVPEPSSALLLGLGAAGLYWLRRRRQTA
jgi:hypothetical protein